MKTVLIIGGSGGIGSEITKLLLETGYFVINCDKKELKIKSAMLLNILVDFEHNYNEIIDNIILKYDIYAFVSAIGYYGVKTYNTFNIEEYYKTQKINVEVPIDVTMKLLNGMIERNNGKLIYISSAAAYIGSRDLSYSVSKAGIIGFMKGICKNMRNKNIFSYCVAPGIVETNMSDNMEEQRQNDAINMTLNGRKCSPKEIANICLFLINKDEGYQNGAVIHINNGLYMN